MSEPTTQSQNTLHDIFLIRVDCKFGTWIHQGKMYRTFKAAAIECEVLNKSDTAKVFERVYTPIKVPPLENDE